MKRSFITSVAAWVMVASLAPDATAKGKPRHEKPTHMVVKAGETGDLYATFQTSVGDIIVRLYEKDAPKTVANFTGLANGSKEWKNPLSGKWENRPLYDGTTFHRVIPEFMIQGGDPFTGPDGDVSRAGAGNPGYRFEDELNNGHVFDKGGYLAMANSGPDTNGSQFFITEVATRHLDNKHTIFGEVVSGQEHVPEIAAAGDNHVRLVKLTIVRGTLARQ
jgi:peptidyl-prolyl cis-trans isomerase A (cyclophilin A)